MAKYRKKPVVIDAVQLCWRNWSEICDFVEINLARSVDDFSDNCGELAGPYIELIIPTLEGNHVAKHGDFILKGIQGEFYPCKPDIFAKTYELVEEKEVEN